ncbi:MAG: Smr/MutS family protein [Bacteroidia bacterium]|nr:Smr/MutS family protein [Bacteroidia bacterium]NNF30052.1 DNA mismatch repair protein MutS [Flavobacteriaceae bacterium]MBT8277045.1 Smr/MutS family protein [Bacteroidia bacterium]NNJ82732.1 DNA mismatch repair protein MutS [Flavobacteriaceae bacterium]NNK55628.1 DNA mismatch repair protein MutS [Flavobacteriaceae bacterium]
MEKGDLVETVDDAIKGVVLKVENGTVTLLTEDDFEMQFEIGELVVTNTKISDSELLPEDTAVLLAEKESSKPRKNTRIKPKLRSQPAMEVDLHIHKLVNSTKHMANHDMLTIQLDTAKRQLDFAIRKRIQRVVFIHGVGDGILKAELEYLFRRYENLKYYDANFQKYGRGATEVYIFQSKSP